jgi:transposase
LDGKTNRKGAVFMTKLSKEERLEAVKAIAAGESIADVAIRYQKSRDVMEFYFRLYQEHGKEGLQSNNYGLVGEQKYQILRYMHENHLSYKETCIQFGVSGSSTIWQWEQKYLGNGIEGLENKKKGRKPRVQKPNPPKTRLEELEEENLDLRIENEYLKKLNALVAEREKRESGNR